LASHLRWGEGPISSGCLPMPTAPRPAVPPDPAGSQDRAAALELLHRLLDPQLLQAWQPTRYNAVYTTTAVVWLLLFQRLHPNASLAAAVAEFCERAGTLSSNKRVRDNTLSLNTGAYSKARSRLLVEVTERTADHVFATLRPQAAAAATYLLDGSSLSLASVKALRAQWPSAPNQHGTTPWPILQIAFATELSTGLTLRPELGAMFGPQAASEQELAIGLLPRIPKGSRLIADRNFGVFQFVWAATQAGYTTLTRLTQPRFQALKHRATPIDGTRWTLTWTPSAWERKHHPHLPADANVKATLHEFVGHSGQTLWVVSTGNESTAQVAADYARRTEIETNLRHFKKTLATDALRSTSPDMVRKELNMSLVAYNLVVQLRAVAAARAKIAPKKLSFSGVWTILIHMVLPAKARTANEWNKLFEWALRGCLQRKLPERSGRSYPRKVLPKSRKFPSRPTPPE
jgi:predicted secreted protein